MTEDKKNIYTKDFSYDRWKLRLGKQQQRLLISALYTMPDRSFTLFQTCKWTLKRKKLMQDLVEKGLFEANERIWHTENTDYQPDMIVETVYTLTTVGERVVKAVIEGDVNYEPKNIVKEL